MVENKITIKTNNKPRELICGWELTDTERKDFDYIGELDDHEKWNNETSYRFFRYKGNLYDIHQFVRIVPLYKSVGFEHGTNDSELLQWHGIQTDSFFSAIVVKYCDDYESIIVGLYCV
jgi:hypothetical protein